MAEPSIKECFRLLKLGRGADFSAVKQAYRQNLNKCHPDRFQKKPELIPIAEQKTKRLIQVYGILERWYQDNGGIDPASRGAEASKGPEAQDRDPEEGIVPPSSRRRRVGLAAAAAVAVLGIVAWQFYSGSAEIDKPAPVADSKAVAGPPPAVIPPAKIEPPLQSTPKAPVPLQARTAELDAIVAERDRVRSEWVAGYMRDREAERASAGRELAAAQAQYGSFIQGNASAIKGAQDETARQLEQAKRQSAIARESFARQEQADAAALRLGYDDWLLARGKEAVALVQEIRRRENSDIGVFSDTEDPRKIFEFWTAEEAGGPEINIAAKTGVTVSQPDDRFFPHFRSNIFLYDPQGQVLVRMMGSIVEKHDALFKEIADRKTAAETELANWDTVHPMKPVQLGGSLQLVVEGRDEAADRLARARVRLDGANLAFSLSKANSAFARSPEGKKWADRILAAQANLGAIKAAH